MTLTAPSLSSRARSRPAMDNARAAEALIMLALIAAIATQAKAIADALSHFF